MLLLCFWFGCNSYVLDQRNQNNPTTQLQLKRRIQAGNANALEVWWWRIVRISVKFGGFCFNGRICWAQCWIIHPFEIFNIAWLNQPPCCAGG